MLTPVTVAVAGSLFAVSAQSSEGTDLRPGRYTDLASLVEAEAGDYATLQDRVTALGDEVQELAGQRGNRQVRQVQQAVEAISPNAGLGEESGTGMRVVLSDSPATLADGSGLDPRLFVVHQQDIQAVVNALWRGGARAVTVQGQRIVSTTGISCQGNSVTLHGVPYPQPYVIEAVGDPAALADALSDDSYLQLYRTQAADPAIRIGYEQAEESDVQAPAYTGLLDLSYARALR